MESFHSATWPRATFTAVGCPRIHRRIKSNDIAERESKLVFHKFEYDKRKKRVPSFSGRMEIS